MPSFATPHLLGRVTYADNHRFSPDGDTIHLRNPVLIDAGGVRKPKDGKFVVQMPGSEPKELLLRPKSNPNYLTIRLAGIDAPEEHYRGAPLELGGIKYKLAKGKPELAQPRWSPATTYLIDALERAGWALIELDRSVLDDHDRVLGYVYASTAKAAKGRFLTLELLKRGLAFPFVFESAEAYVPTFLKAGARARADRKGVWKHYQDAPLPYADALPAPDRYTDEESAAQLALPLNLPMVFRRIVDAEHLTGGITLDIALRKYDCIDYGTGDLVTGNHYQQVPIDRRIWAPHEY